MRTADVVVATREELSARLQGGRRATAHFREVALPMGMPMRRAAGTRPARGRRVEREERATREVGNFDESRDALLPECRAGAGEGWGRVWRVEDGCTGELTEESRRGALANLRCATRAQHFPGP